MPPALQVLRRVKGRASEQNKNQQTKPCAGARHTVFAAVQCRIRAGRTQHSLSSPRYTQYEARGEYTSSVVQDKKRLLHTTRKTDTTSAIKASDCHATNKSVGRKRSSSPPTPRPPSISTGRAVARPRSCPLLRDFRAVDTWGAAAAAASASASACRR